MVPFIRDIPLSISLMFAACSSAEAEMLSTAAEMLSTWPTICDREAEVFSASSVPPDMDSREFSISSLVRAAASVDLAARVRTSSATTAKPRPLSPARAASTAALRERILVWKAMSSITLMMSSISAEEDFMCCMASTMRCICSCPSFACSPARAVISRALRASLAFSVILRDMSVTDSVSWLTAADSS